MNAVTPAFAAPFDIEAHNAACARRAAFILEAPVCEAQPALTVRDMPSAEADVLRLMPARLGATISDLRALAARLTGSTREYADGLVSDLDESGFALLAEDTEREARHDAEFAPGQDRHDATRGEFA